MRKFFSMTILATLAVVMAGCGGSEDAFTDPGASGTAPPVIGSLTITTSTPTIPTDGSTAADLRAFVRDANNVAMEGVTVSFSASAGSLTITQAATGADGIATATLAAPPDNLANQAITITASVGTRQATVLVNTTGTRLSIQGANAAVLTQQNTYTVSLIDSGDGGIAAQNISITSAQGNTLSASTVTTNSSGQATFTVTTTQPGNDTVTVTGLGLTASQNVAVNADSFSMTTPAADGAEVALNTPQTITVRWLSSGSAVVGQSINFAATRGTLSAASATTNASGDATITVQSTSAGAATVTATAASATAQRTIEFVASTAASIDVQPGIFTLAPNELTTLTATVRDAVGNLVKNKLVNFNVQDTTGGSLSVASATTNSQGRAQSVYTAGTTTSATDGVVVTAQVVQAGPLISDTVALTVARKEVFISVGTGNTITEPNEAQYQIQFVVQVTDSSGNGVAGVPLVVSIVSESYLKGKRLFASGAWTSYNPLFGPCADEDTNHNGVLDPTEDFNSSTRLEAGNIALVTPSSVTTGTDGSALVSVRYPQEHAYWVNVKLEASASVQGTEFKRASHFLLPGAATDFTTQTTSPPGPNSPFGINACNQPD